MNNKPKTFLQKYADENGLSNQPPNPHASEAAYRRGYHHGVVVTLETIASRLSEPDLKLLYEWQNWFYVWRNAGMRDKYIPPQPPILSVGRRARSPS